MKEVENVRKKYEFYLSFRTIDVRSRGQQSEQSIVYGLMKYSPDRPIRKILDK